MTDVIKEHGDLGLGMLRASESYLEDTMQNSADAESRLEVRNAALKKKILALKGKIDRQLTRLNDWVPKFVPQKEDPQNEFDYLDRKLATLKEDLQAIQTSLSSEE